MAQADKHDYRKFNHHAADYLMVYVSDARLGILNDLYGPVAPVPSRTFKS
jgi:hypothetical protein